MEELTFSAQCIEEAHWHIRDFCRHHYSERLECIAKDLEGVLATLDAFIEEKRSKDEQKLQN